MLIVRGAGFNPTKLKLRTARFLKSAVFLLGGIARRAAFAATQNPFATTGCTNQGAARRSPGLLSRAGSAPLTKNPSPEAMAEAISEITLSTMNHSQADWSTWDTGKPHRSARAQHGIDRSA